MTQYLILQFATCSRSYTSLKLHLCGWGASFPLELTLESPVHMQYMD